MLRKAWQVLVAVASAATMLSCATPGVTTGGGGGSASAGTTIRIGLDTGARSVSLEGSAELSLVVGVSRLSGNAFTILANGTEVRVTGSGGEARGSEVVCTSGSPIRVDGTAYRGAIEIKPSGGTLTVVNIVGVEDYLRGVVPS